MKKLFYTILLFPLLLVAQQPVITNISPTSGTVGTTVNITGNNLNGSRVFFGGVEAVVTDINESRLTASVPAGATHGSIYLINNNRSTQSSQQFFISHSGSDIDTYDDQIISTTENNAYDICMCDLDGDGKNDIAMAHNSPDNAGSELTIYRNTTTGGGPFTHAGIIKINGSVNEQGAIAVTCADLNNDGRPELIYSANSATFAKEVFVFRNQSSSGNINMSYNSGASLSLPLAAGGINRVARKAKIADVDADGHQDIVVGNELDATLHVFKGNGNLTFDAPDEIVVGGAPRTSSIELADFNGDKRVDVAIVPFRQSNQRIYVLKNTSAPNDVSFELEAGITASSERINIVSADFDGDNKIDIAITNLQLKRVSIHRNISTRTDIIFADAINVSIPNGNPWGLDIGDMNGDGRPDLVVGSTSANDELYILENTSSGSISFDAPTALGTGNTNQNLAIGDLNDDGKPDIAYTQNIQPGNPGNLGIFINRNCIEPEISPANLEFCTGDPFTLTATNSLNGTYSWEIISGTGTNPTDTDNEAVFTIPSGTSATVLVTLTQNGCSRSSSVNLSLIGGTPPAPPLFASGNSENICVGEDFTINTTGGSYEEYEWTRPDGSLFTSSSSTFTITNAQFSDAGSYLLRGKETSGCYSQTQRTFTLGVSQPALFEIANVGEDNFCSSSSVQLRVPDFSATNNYQWFRNGNPVGSNSPTLSASQSGNYTLTITEDTPEACEVTTSPYTINAITEPVSSIDGATTLCLNFENTFTATSTGQSGFDLEYAWEVDGTPVSPTNPTQLTTSFNTLGAHTVRLTTSYNADQVASCEDVITLNLTVVEAPTIVYSPAVNSTTEKCPSDVVPILLTDGVSDIVSYEWQVFDQLADTLIETSNASSIDAGTPQNVATVRVVSTVTTTTGCEIVSEFTVKNFDNSNLGIAEGIAALEAPTPSDTLFRGISYPLIQLEDASFIRLEATGGSNYSWEPAQSIDNPTAASVTYFPSQPLSLVTVSGVDNNGCNESYTVAIFLDNFRPRKTFSPNGDGMNDCWEILNIGDLGNGAGCEVFIFDSRGRKIMTKSRFSDSEGNCVWDGNFTNSPVPEGVYYYILKCGNTGITKSGSILLAR